MWGEPGEGWRREPFVRSQDFSFWVGGTLGLNTMAEGGIQKPIKSKTRQDYGQYLKKIHGYSEVFLISLFLVEIRLAPPIPDP